MRLLITLTFAATACSLFSCASDDKAASGPPEARLAAVVVVKGSPTLRVPFALTNPSKGIVTYALDPTGPGLYHMSGRLFQDGKEAWRPVTTQKLPFDKRQVRKLKPNESVTLEFDTKDEIKPGKYELRLKYEIYAKSVDELEFGLTPMKLEQTILLDVQKE